MNKKKKKEEIYNCYKGHRNILHYVKIENIIKTPRATPEPCIALN